jgi:DNA-binding transcriptional ArsR family regulator
MGADLHRKRRQSKGHPFVQLFNYVIDSPAYRGLPPAARAALVEFARLYNGSNNGHLAMSARSLADRLGVSKSMASRVLLKLEEAGFIETVKVGSFQRRDRMASEYRLTFYRCDASSTAPSRAFQKIG